MATFRGRHRFFRVGGLESVDSMDRPDTKMANMDLMIQRSSSR